MSLVWLGLSLALAGFAMAGPLRWATAVVIFFIPFSATQAFSIGGVPVLVPLVVAVGFLARHAFSLLVRPLRQQFLTLLRTDGPLVVFVAYVVISGLFFPRLFEGATYVTPQLSGPPTLLDPAQISIPQIAYVVIAAYLYLALRQAMLRVGLAPALHAVLAQIAFIGGVGLLQAALAVAHINVPMDWIVNTPLGRLGAGLGRVHSVFAEASVFAAWGSAAIAFCYALYINRIMPGLTLCFAAGLSVALLLSVSSAAFAGLAIVGVFAFVCAISDSDLRRRDRGLLVLIGGTLTMAGAGLAVFNADAGFLRDLILRFTVEEGASNISTERALWADRSFQNAWDTGLLGVGYGAARSSGLFASLAGAMGAPGVLLFLAIVVPRILLALRRPHTGEDAVVSAAAFGLFAAIATMTLVSPDLSLASCFWVFLPIASAPLAQRAALRAAKNAGARVLPI